MVLNYQQTMDLQVIIKEVIRATWTASGFALTFRTAFAVAWAWTQIKDKYVITEIASVINYYGRNIFDRHIKRVKKCYT